MLNDAILHPESSYRVLCDYDGYQEATQFVSSHLRTGTKATYCSKNSYWRIV
jgi:hypothetical protein